MKKYISHRVKSKKAIVQYGQKVDVKDVRDRVKKSITFNNRLQISSFVLGGSKNDLRKRYKTTAWLYNNNITKHILVRSDITKTNYDHSMGRNLTVNEWSMKTLTSMGIHELDVEYLYLESGFWGTLSEGKRVSSILIEKGIRNVILITSHNHTQRTYEVYSTLLGERDIRFTIYAAQDDNLFRSLLIEYIKLLTYRIMLPFIALH